MIVAAGELESRLAPKATPPKLLPIKLLRSIVIEEALDALLESSETTMP